MGNGLYSYGNLNSSYNGLGENSLINNAMVNQHKAQSRADQQRNSQEQHLLQQRQRLEMERQRKAAQDLDAYDPFGKGGGGAPVRDKDGKVITDRRRLRKSWNSVQDTNLPHDFDGTRISPSQSMNGGLNQIGYATDPFAQSVFGTTSTLGGPSPYNLNSSVGRVPSARFQGVAAPTVQSHELTEKEKHMAELRKQIEEKKRERELEAEKERLEEEREQMRIEKENAKIKAELEEEKRKQQEKMAAHEKKQQELQEIARKKAEEAAAARKPAFHNRQPAGTQNPTTPAEDDGLEWWEKKQPQREPSRQSSHRALNVTNGHHTPIEDSRGSTPAPRQVVYTPPPDATYDSAQTLQKEEISESPPLPVRRTAERPKNSDDEEEKMRQNKEFKPRSAMVRNEGVMRQLSAMRERLTKEQMRVKSALGRKEYGEDVFSDEDVPLDGLDELDDVPSLAKFKKKKRSKSPQQASALSGLFSDEEDKPRKSRHSKKEPRLTSGLLSDDDVDITTSRSKNKSRRRSTLSGDDDTPLASLIKNTRTLLDSAGPKRSKSSVSRLSSGSGGRKMKGFLSSSDDDDDFPSMTKNFKKNFQDDDFPSLSKSRSKTQRSRKLDLDFD